MKLFRRNAANKRSKNAVCSGLSALGVFVMFFALPAQAGMEISKPKLVYKNSNRSIYLVNGLYYFSPSEKRPQGDSFKNYRKDLFIRVPGVWNEAFNAGDQVVNAKGQVVASLPELSRQKWNYGLYSLPVEIPDAWRGKYIFLDVPDVQFEGELYVNGMPVRKLSGWACKRINLNDFLKPGGHVLIQILVKGFEKDKIPYSDKLKTRRRYAGIISDVSFSVLDNPVFGRFTKLKTELKNKEAEFTLEISNSSGKSIQGGIELLLSRNKKKKAAGIINSYIPKGKSSHKISIPLGNIKLWYPDDPQLYDVLANIKKDGKVIDSIPERKTGFREVCFHGTEFRINGVRTTLFSESAARIAMTMNQCGNLKLIKNYLDIYKKMGFNTINLDDLRELNETLACSDEIGMMALLGLSRLRYLALPYMDRNFRHFEQEVPDKAINEYIMKGKGFIERFALNPSLVMCYSGMNFACHSNDAYNHHKLGTRHPYNEIMKEKSHFSNKISEALYKLDSSKEYFHWHNGPTGKAYTHNRYVSFGLPLQENCDFLKLWDQNQTDKKMPFMVVESFFGGFYGIFNKWGISPKNKKWKGFSPPFMVAEYSSMYLGPAAYFLKELQKPKVRRSQKISEFFAMREIPSFLYYNITGYFTHTDSYDGFETEKEPSRKDEGAKLSDNVPGFVSNTQIWKGPSSKLTETGRVFGDVFSPLNMFIMGPEGNPTSVEHLFYASEEISKSVFIINETSKSHHLKVKMELEDGNKKYPIADFNVMLKPGERLFKPVLIKLPKESSQKTFNLSAFMSEDGKIVKSRTFEMKVFPPFDKSINAGNEIAYYDASGILENIFHAYKIEGYKKIKEIKDLKDIKLIIVGRKSLDRIFEKCAVKLNVPEWVRNGGRVIILEQEGEELLGLNLDCRRLRYSFATAPGNPFLDNLDNTCLNNWRDKGDMIPEFPKAGPGYSFSKLLNTTNTGIVSSFLIEKPHKGSFSNIIDAGYDLQYSPLIVFRDGKGKIILSQLDLSNRIGKDPAATILLYNIIKNALKPEKSENKNWAWCGGGATQNFVHDFYLKADKINASSQLRDYSDLILGAGSEKVLTKKEITDFLDKGGNIICLWTSGMEKILPTKMTVEKINGNQIYKSEKEAEKRKLPISVSDTYWHDKFAFNGWVFKDFDVNPLLGRINWGNGCIAYCRVDPNKFKGHFFRMKAVRLWNVLLNAFDAPRTTSFSERLLNFSRSSRLSLGNFAYFRTDPENAGVKNGWMNFELKSKKGWKKIVVPGFFEKVPFLEAFGDPNPPAAAPDYNGYAWYRFEIEIPKEMKGSAAVLSLGVVDDYDWTYFNGKLVGHIGKEFGAYAYAAERKYRIPASLIKYGEKNVIAVRVNDLQCAGGFARGPLELKFVSDKPSLASPYMPDASIEEVFGVSPYYNEQW